MLFSLFRAFVATAAPLGMAAAAMAAAPIDIQSLQGVAPPPNAIWLDSLDVRKVEQEKGVARGGQSFDGGPLRICGNTFQHGIGTNAYSRCCVDLKGAATGFAVVVGIDDETGGQGSVTFTIWVDGTIRAIRPWKKGAEPALVLIGLHGAKEMRMIVESDAGPVGNHADWAGAAIVLDPKATARPEIVALPPSPVPAIAHVQSPLPALHGPRVTGATPGRPFLFKVPATGEKPLRFSATNLPEGLSLDPETGIITGALKQEGTTAVRLSVSNARGHDERLLTIVGGPHKLALTPPMGWSSWNCWAYGVDDKKVRLSADAMIRSGLADHGFQYINIDDCWEGGLDAEGATRPNQKFPDMKALADYVHAKGLKFGIYSSPGPTTCAGYQGSFGHEQRDANVFAKWGVDYLKYDLCSYGRSPLTPRIRTLADAQKPYQVMGKALDKCGRDIVYSLCQYGSSDVWKWGAEVGGNCWRTTGDIVDDWGSVAGIGFGQKGLEACAGPGHWNDPDMLVVGRVGWGAPSLRPTRLTPDEQLTHITLWCLLAAPLLIGCDMTALDDFTLALLTNDEVLDVDQDPLGKAAGPVVVHGRKQVWARPLSDGATAVGLFNLDYQPGPVTIDWAALGLRAPQRVRDLWRQKDLGTLATGYQAVVPAHGAMLIKVRQED